MRVLIVTGGRADYGILSPVIKAVHDAPDFTLQLVVTGSHLVPAFGETRKVIEADGFPIARAVDIVLMNDSPGGVSRSLGLAILGFAEALEALRPDLVMVLGDRYEILGAAAAAALANLPIAHLHGGEITEGAVDERIRHAVTKLATVHYAASEDSARRIRQMGENPDAVVIAGAPGLDVVRETPHLSRAELCRELGVDAGRAYFLVTYHSVTAGTGAAGVHALLSALAARDEQIVLTGTNVDAGNNEVRDALSRFATEQGGRTVIRPSLGQRLYINAMRHASAVVGNSSSGIIEAPFVGVPTVNIGDRQKGRAAAASIVNCVEDAGAIGDAIARVVEPSFRAGLGQTRSLFGDGFATERIVGDLRKRRHSLAARKTFHDIGTGASGSCETFP